MFVTKFFNMKNHIVGHMHTHRGYKAFECQKCKKSFAYKCTLQNHSACCGEKTSHTCAQCGIDVSSKAALKQHMNRKHGNVV